MMQQCVIHAPHSDDVRHDVYLTLMNGVFNRGVKRADKNVQIDLEVLDEKDNVIEVCARWCLIAT